MTHPDSSLKAVLAVLLVGNVTTKTYIDDMEVNGFKIEPGANLKWKEQECTSHGRRTPTY